MALAAGVPHSWLDALGEWEDSPLFDPPTRAALALVDEMHRLTVGAPTVATLGTYLSPGEIVELVVCIAHYQSTARILQALDIAVEPAYLALGDHPASPPLARHKRAVS
jgi:alkylhydroperoxidase family enzyme